MSANNKDWVVSNIKSSVVTDNAPKLPQPSQLVYGQIAVNYAAGHETLSIKNSNNEIATFSTEKLRYLNQTGAAPSAYTFESLETVYDHIRIFKTSGMDLYDEEPNCFYVAKFIDEQGNEAMYPVVSPTAEYASLIDPNRPVKIAKQPRGHGGEGEPSKLYPASKVIARRHLPLRPNMNLPYFFMSRIIMEFYLGPSKSFKVLFNPPSMAEVNFVSDGPGAEGNQRLTYEGNGIYTNSTNDYIKVEMIVGGNNLYSAWLAKVKHPYLFTRYCKNKETLIAEQPDIAATRNDFLLIDLKQLEVHEIDENKRCGIWETTSPYLKVAGRTVICDHPTYFDSQNTDIFTREPEIRLTPYNPMQLQQLRKLPKIPKRQGYVYYKPRGFWKYNEADTRMDMRENKDRIFVEIADFQNLPGTPARDNIALHVYRKTNRLNLPAGSEVVIHLWSYDTGDIAVPVPITGNTLDVYLREDDPALTEKGIVTLRAFKVVSYIFNQTLSEAGALLAKEWANKKYYRNRFVRVKRDKRLSMLTVRRSCIFNHKNQYELRYVKRHRGLLGRPLTIIVSDGKHSNFAGFWNT